MAESASPRPSRSRSRSPSQHSDAEPGACSDSEHRDDYDKQERSVTIVSSRGDTGRGRAGLDNRTSDHSLAAKSNNTGTKRSTQLAEKSRQSQPEPNAKPRGSVSNTPLRQPRAPTSVQRLEPARSNPNPSHSAAYGGADSNPTDAAVAPGGQGAKDDGHHSRERADSRPLRPLNDTRGRRIDFPPEKKQYQYQQPPDDIIFTIFNRYERYSVDVHEWKNDDGIYYHGFQYYRGAPSAGYRSPANQIGARSRSYLGRYSPEYPPPAAASPAVKRERSPERMAPAEYERSPKRSRGLADSYGNQQDSFMQHKFNVPRPDHGDYSAGAYPSQPQPPPELMDQFYQFLQSSQHAGNQNPGMDRPRYQPYKY